MPFSWLYPTGEKQNTITPKWGKYYAEADIIAGDFPFIRRYMPDDLDGQDHSHQHHSSRRCGGTEKRGVKTLITTTPQIDGGSFGTNVMEGVLVALSGKKPRQLTPADYMDLLPNSTGRRRSRRSILNITPNDYSHPRADLGCTVFC